MKKKGEIMTNEAFGFILGAAGVVVLFLLVFALYSASKVDKDKETAESYFNTLAEEISRAEKGGTGDFSIWQEDETKYFVVYFGDRLKVEDSGKVFYSLDANVNKICVCYYKKGAEEGVCGNCENLKYPAKKDDVEGSFVISGGVEFNIYKATSSNFFDFKVKND